MSSRSSVVPWPAPAPLQLALLAVRLGLPAVSDPPTAAPRLDPEGSAQSWPSWAPGPSPPSSSPRGSDWACVSPSPVGSNLGFRRRFRREEQGVRLGSVLILSRVARLAIGPQKAAVTQPVQNRCSTAKSQRIGQQCHQVADYPQDRIRGSKWARFSRAIPAFPPAPATLPRRRRAHGACAPAGSSAYRTRRGRGRTGPGRSAGSPGP